MVIDALRRQQVRQQPTVVLSVVSFGAEVIADGSTLRLMAAPSLALEAIPRRGFTPPA